MKNTDRLTIDIHSKEMEESLNSRSCARKLLTLGIDSNKKRGEMTIHYKVTKLPAVFTKPKPAKRFILWLEEKE